MTDADTDDGRGERGRRVRVGVDVQAISRFRQFDPAVAPRIKRRVFTEDERAYCEGTRYPAQHYAARWAAKEAFVKLVGGLDGLSYDSVGVVSGPSGPWLDLDDDAADALRRAVDQPSGPVSHDLSVSHDRDGDVAMAQVVACRGRADP